MNNTDGWPGATPERRRAVRPSVRCMLVGSILILATGCGVLRAPQKMVTAVIPGSQSQAADPAEVQVQALRFASDYAIRTSQAIDEYARLMGTASARVDALQWKIGSVSAVANIASGPNPLANMLDLVTVATLTRGTLEDYWTKTTNGPAFQPWLEASRLLGSNAWEMAAHFLKPNQLDELRSTIRGWQARNPQARSALFVRPQEFASMVKARSDGGTDVNSVYAFVGLDPTSGLDPAVREITRSRLFGERVMFTLQFMPHLVRWQAEMLAYQLAGQPAVQLALTNTTDLSGSIDRISRGWENTSQVISNLPDRITVERKAILAALETQEGKLRELATEVNRSLISADKMSTSLNTTIASFDGLMKRFGVGEPSTNAAPGTNARPFNVLDYGTVATQVGAMARDLNALINTADRSVPQVGVLGQQAGGEIGRLVDHAFRLGLILIAVLVGGMLLAGLLYRFLAERMVRSRPTSPPQNQ